MSRWIATSLAALWLAVPALAADPPAKTDAPDRGKELQAIVDDLKKAMPAIVKEFQGAESAEGRQRAVDKIVPFGERALKLAEADPKDEAGLNALSFVVASIGGAPPTPKTRAAMGKAVALLVENHADSDGAAGLVQLFTQRPNREGSKFLRAVAAKSKNKTLRGTATFGLAKALMSEAEEVHATDKEAADKLSKEAEGFLQTVEKEYAGVKSEEGDLAALAGSELFTLRNLSVGRAPADIEGELLDGTKAKLSQYRGKVLVLDIWATWCPPCRAMIPHERELVERMKDKPFVLVSVSADNDKDTLKKFIEKEPMPWTHWFNGPQGGIVEKWNVRFFPTIYVLDANGVIRYKGVRGKDMDDAVDTLMKEIKPKKS